LIAQSKAPLENYSANIGFGLRIVIISVNLVKGNVMTVIELKEKLIKKIITTNDEELLEELSWIIDVEEPNNEIHVMSEGEIEAVNEGLAQLDRGEWISNEEANRRADEWLKK